MQWNFSPEDIVLGKASYSIAEFINDLQEEITSLIDNPSVAPEVMNELGSMSYYVLRVCDLAALGKNAAAIAQQYGDFTLTEEDVGQIEATMEQHAEKIEMLKAIYHKIFLDAFKVCGEKEAAWNEFLAEREEAFTQQIETR